YLGNWKMLHYFAVRFFAPLLVSAYVDGDRLLVYAIDDLYAGEPYNLRLDVRLYHYGSFVPRLSLTHVFPMSSLVQVVSAKNLSELLSSASCSRNNSFLTFRLSNDSDGETLSSNFLLLQVPRLATEIPSAALKAGLGSFRGRCRQCRCWRSLRSPARSTKGVTKAAHAARGIRVRTLHGGPVAACMDGCVPVLLALWAYATLSGE
ncbi:hypothetical protein HPB47_022960, partial [Ixodes persulcatus]